MTENPTVRTPPGLPQFPTNPSVTVTVEETGDSGGEIRCICEYTEDDGYTICCDKCETWQHIICMQLPEEDLSSKYLCSSCLPRDVDARRARELQKQRRREEKKNNSRKRPATASHRRKETLTTQLDKTGTVKLPSPREPQPPTSRKRNQRNTNSNQVTSTFTAVAVSAAASPAQQPEKNGDADDDTEFEKYKYEFIDISSQRDKYSNEKVREFLFTKTVVPSSETSSFERNLRRFSERDFSSTVFPKASVRSLPDTPKLYSEHSRWCYMLEAPCPVENLVALFKGEVGFQESYKKEPINQYSFWNHPKPYVVFHPQLPIYIDARHCGSEARFVRRSCQPNLGVQTIVIDQSNVLFGLYALDTLKPGTELTIGWDWNASGHSRRLAEQNFDFSKLAPEELRQAADWAENLLEKMGDCACAGGDSCLLSKVRKCGGLDVASTKIALPNGNGTRKQRSKRNPSSERNASKEQTPDIMNGLQMDEDENKAIKPQSRDLTPSNAQDTAVEQGSMTGREARKFKEVLSRIEKQEQQEQTFPPPQKRRKRNSTISIADNTSFTSPASEENSKPKSSSPGMSPRSANSREVSVVDASTSARSPASSAASDERKRRVHRTSAQSPTEAARSSTSTKVRRKVKTRTTKVVYVDCAVQTDSDEGLPWWKQNLQSAPTRAPRLPLRKRLMQSFLRDREMAANPVGPAASQDKKRKLDSISEDEPLTQGPSKVVKAAGAESVRSDCVETQKSETQSSAPSSVSNPFPTFNQNTTNSNIVGLKDAKDSSSPAPASGPSLKDIFTELPNIKKPRISTEPTVEAAGKPRDESQERPDKTQINGTKPPGLQLQTLSASNGPNASSTAGTKGHSPLSSSAAPFSPSVMAAVNGGNGSNPSPTRTKKLSLKEYTNTKRKPHKPTDGPIEGKDDSRNIPKSMVEANGEGQLALLEGLPAGSLSSPSRTTAVDAKMISERAAKTWGVR